MKSKIELCDVEHCTQCFACITVCPKQCITMSETCDGFRYPVINKEVCIACGLCIRFCHQLSFSSLSDVSSQVYAGWTTNLDIRTNSSSGGVFSVLAEYIIQEGGVVYGAAYVDSLKVKHLRIVDANDLHLLRGSKYVQSDLAGVFGHVRSDLEKKMKVLFTGTPCQVAGLRTFLNSEYENLFCVDLVCHGVPAQKMFDHYLLHIGIQPKIGDCFDFRYCKGWGYELAYNKHCLSPAKGYYLKAFTAGYMFGEACYACKYACQKRVGDITLGDFWGVGLKVPFPYPTFQGVSLVLANTLKGKCLLLENKGHLFLIERTFEEAAVYNHNLIHPSHRPPERDAYPMDSIIMNKKDLMKKYGLKPDWKEWLRPLKKRFFTLVSK